MQDRNKFNDCVSDLIALDEVNINGNLNVSKELYLSLQFFPTTGKLVQCSVQLMNWSSCLPEICGTDPGISAAFLASSISLGSGRFQSALGSLGF